MIFTWLRRRRRRRLLEQDFPQSWNEHLQRNVPAYHALNADEQARLRGDLRIFAAEKRWEGCGGLAVTDEMRVTVSAWACLLTLNLQHDFFSRVKSILIYPRGYFGPERSHLGLIGPPDLRLGEAWYRGPVVLSWSDVRRARRRDARDNVVLHEFAHQLDMLDRVVDGTPPLESRGQYQTWAEVMNAEYARLAEDWDQGRSTVLDPYGTINEGEFFAVATEAFFMQPVDLREKHPRLYELLAGYYRQDPARRLHHLA
jgi:Mlc titration factor MtfA (ptsG expression regulator)